MRKIVSVIFIILILFFGISPNLQSRTLDMLQIPIEEPAITATEAAAMQRFYANDELIYGKIKEAKRTKKVDKERYQKFMQENYPSVKFKILNIENGFGVRNIIGQEAVCLDIENNFEFTIYYESPFEYFSHDIETGFLKCNVWTSKYPKMYSDYLHMKRVNCVILPKVTSLIKNTTLFYKVEISKTYFNKRCITPEITRQYIKYVGTPAAISLYQKDSKSDLGEIIDTLDYLLNTISIQYPEVCLILKNAKSGLTINISQLTYKSLRNLGNYDKNCTDCNTLPNNIYICKKCRISEKLRFLYYLATSEMNCTYCGKTVISANLCPYCGHKTYHDYGIYCRKGHMGYVGMKCLYCIESSKK